MNSEKNLHNNTRRTYFGEDVHWIIRKLLPWLRWETGRSGFGDNEEKVEALKADQVTFFRKIQTQSDSNSAAQ